ncbi:MAG: hypothetical protein JXQ65_01855 [Candidatus Marinimicrobia bacterium]|nr:hypothetical protein [Candidatus Neomarinimicrobiota bacterium]
MKKIFLLMTIMIISGCHEWQITEEGLIDVFPENLTKDNGKPVFSEVSAVVFDGNNLIFGNDKEIPGDSLQQRSPVFLINYEKFANSDIEFLSDSTFIKAKKYEDFTITPDGKYIIATTGFDRVKGSGEWDNFNTLLYWPVGNPGKVKIMNTTVRNGIESSVSLREKISKKLNDAPYFKIEGLAALPGNKLLFGIREVGASYQNFDYTVKMLLTSYFIEGDEMKIPHDVEWVYDFNPDHFFEKLNSRKVALSSIEYNPFKESVFILTSYENEINGEVTDESIGAFLWEIPLADIFRNNSPKFIESVHFNHKAEGIAIIDKNKIFVIHDDDRVLGSDGGQFLRKPNQNAYSILER